MALVAFPKRAVRRANSPPTASDGCSILDGNCRKFSEVSVQVLSQQMTRFFGVGLAEYSMGAPSGDATGGVIENPASIA